MSQNAGPIAGSVWMRAPRSRQGQPTLSREQIVSAAIELLDEKGLDGLSMRRLGAKLAAGATSAYWYVANKNELLELAADEVFGEIDLPDPEVTGWRAAAGAFAHGMRSVILRHPWITGLFGAFPNVGPNAMRMSDRIVQVLTVAGFRGVELAHASSLLVSHAIGSATNEAAWNRAVARSGKDTTELVAEIQPHIDELAAHYPNYGAWWRENRTMDMERLRNEGFDFGLQRMLDGLQAWLDRRDAGHPA